MGSTNCSSVAGNAKYIGPIEIAIELAMFFDVSTDFLLLGKENYRVDRKQCLRMAIDILSELEAELYRGLL